jgi:hypothetical protein
MPEFTTEQVAEKQRQLREEVRQREELLKAYDLVMTDLRGGSSSAQQIVVHPQIVATNGAPFPERGYGRITHLVRTAMNELDTDFTIKNVHSHLTELHPNMSLDSVTTVINRLRDKGEIRVRRAGSGRRATIFHKYEVN